MATFLEIAVHSVGYMLSLAFFCLYFCISHFGFKSRIWLLIAPVHVHCFSITLRIILKNTFKKELELQRSV